MVVASFLYIMYIAKKLLFIHIYKLNYEWVLVFKVYRLESIIYSAYKNYTQ